MKKVNVARALRDPDYRDRLDADIRNSLPASPAGVVAIDDDALRSITGGCGPSQCNNCGNNNGPTTWLWSCTQPGQACP